MHVVFLFLLFTVTRLKYSLKCQHFQNSLFRLRSLLWLRADYITRKLESSYIGQRPVSGTGYRRRAFDWWFRDRAAWPEARRRPPQIRTSAIDASGSSGLWFRYRFEWTTRAGVKGNTRSIALNRFQFGLLPRLRRTSHFRHILATSHRSLSSMR